MKIAIIGSGISGAILANEIPGSVVFERSARCGGRLATTNFADGSFFDEGATVFRDSEPYIYQQKLQTFAFLDYLQQKAPELIIHKLAHYPNTFYPAGSMQSLAQQLLHDKPLFFHHNLEQIMPASSGKRWLLKFTNQTQEIFDVVVFTQPVVGAISVLKNSGIIQEWDDFSKFFSDYRPVLVLTAIWHNLPPGIRQTIDRLTMTQLDKWQDAQYISIESQKYQSEQQDIIVSIQFSASFSSRNIQRWCDRNKKPHPTAEAAAKVYFQEFFVKQQIPEMAKFPPQEIKARKWRYATIDNPLLARQEKLDFDAKPFQDFLTLCKSHNIWLAGDWLFSSRVIRCALGSYIIAKEIIRLHLAGEPPKARILDNEHSLFQFLS